VFPEELTPKAVQPHRRQGSASLSIGSDICESPIGEVHNRLCLRHIPMALDMGNPASCLVIEKQPAVGGEKHPSWRTIFGVSLSGTCINTLLAFLHYTPESTFSELPITNNPASTNVPAASLSSKNTSLCPPTSRTDHAK
jgi:hypothetical protein